MYIPSHPVWDPTLARPYPPWHCMMMFINTNYNMAVVYKIYLHTNTDQPERHKYKIKWNIVWLYVSTYMYMFICIYTYLYLHICTYIPIYIYTYMYFPINAYMYTYICAYIYLPCIHWWLRKEIIDLIIVYLNKYNNEYKLTIIY
jgi:hypothetical protein